jgi:hypothetical protein
MIKSLLPKAVLAVAALTVPTSIVAGNYPTPRFAQQNSVPKLRTFNPDIFAAKKAATAITPAKRVSSIDPTAEIPGGDGINYLLAPDGSVWYTTTTFTYEEVYVSEYYTEKRITGFEFTVYDNNFQEVGTVKDSYTLEDGETRITSIQPEMTLTQKFFNTDSKYELIVSVFCNTPSYNVVSHSLVYSIGGDTDENGNSVRLQTIPGYVIDSENYATNSFSENYFITFMQEDRPTSTDGFETYRDYLEAYKYKLSTYTKAGWSTPASSILDIDLGELYLPGDAMNTPFFLMTKNADGKPAFVVSYYSEPYFANQEDFSDYTVSENNVLNIDVYTLSSLYATEATKSYETHIQMDPPAEEYLANYYGIGSFNYANDINFTDYSADGSPAFIVTTSSVLATDPDNYINTYYVYSYDGEPVITLDERSESAVVLSSLKDHNRQALFIHSDGDDYIFRVVDLVTGEEVVSLPSTLEDHGLTTSFDNALVNGEVMYASNLSDHVETADGITYEQVAWINTNGEIDHIDQLNLGEDVMYAQVYIDNSVFDPYLFDTDADQEYLVLVKRSQSSTTTATDEFLLVADPKGDPIFTASSDDELGTLYNVSVLNADVNPTLCLLFVDDDDQYNQQFFNLPITKFAGGEGTAESPYLISTIGDLQQIKSNVKANYQLANDIDAAGFDFTPIADFSGTLDGAGHMVSNFSVASSYAQALFESTAEGAVIKNISFDEPVFNLTDDASYAGVVAAQTIGTTIENVNVYNLTAEGDNFTGRFGSIAGVITGSSKIVGCNVAAADIDLPGASVGGVANELKTSSSVKASAFYGDINAGQTVGGIIATGGTGFVVEDCHANVNIVAKNTIGGIVGSAARSTVNRNVVEGTLEATQAGWNSVALGGVIGYLTADYTATDETKIVTNNIVAVTSLTAPEASEDEYANQNSTVHRIVGWTFFNDEPEVVGYDSNWEPIYTTEANPADKGLANNYVTSSLEAVDATIGDESNTTTEGQTIDVYECDSVFLEEELGFAYGTSNDAPWSTAAYTTPYLYFEQKFILTPTEFSVVEGETFTVTAKILSVEDLTADDVMGGFSFECDESLLEMGDMSFDDNVLKIQFTCKKAGTSTITLRLLGSTGKVTVYGTSGVESIAEAATAKAISYNGSTVSCPASTLTIYSLTGSQLATGYETLSVDNLSAGVYVVVATAPNFKAVAKIAVR